MGMTIKITGQNCLEACNKVINKKRTEKIWIIRDLITIITTMARAIMGPVETEITVVTDLVETVAETTVADRVSWHLSC